MHMVMESHCSRAFRDIVNGADLVTPDGMPLVWGLHLLGVASATRVYGPDLTSALLEAAAKEHLPVGFYGGTPAVRDRLLQILSRRFPGLRLAFWESPPFRAPTVDEDRVVVDQINRSGARILFVGLGCPKQERWMAEHAGKVSAVMVGVGAAFDFLSGAKAQAPRWMQQSGLEWFFRLCTEPRRLWRRYLWLGPQFVGLFVLQLLAERTSKA
jgi:N-acetylglucosaminyldiphosphoundecaprenol N-acetyl-beta-D-mannosaminyltransferase